MRLLRLALILSLLVLLTSSLFCADPAPNPEERLRQARAEYDSRAAKVRPDSLDQHLDLALWCVNNGLPEEAQDQVCLGGSLNPRSELLVATWSEILKKLPARNVGVTLTLEDRRTVRATCALQPVLLRTADRVLIILPDSLKSMTYVIPGAGEPYFALRAADEDFQGVLVVPPRFTDLRDRRPIDFIAVRNVVFIAPAPPPPQPPPQAPQPPPPPPGSSLEELLPAWNDQLAEINKTGLDVVIVFDSTGSMGPAIREIRAGLPRLAKLLATLVPDARVGMVTYRDLREFAPADYEYTVKSLPLTYDLDSLQTFLGPIQALAGGDVPEAVYEGLQTAVSAKSGWRKGARKVILLFGDAPPRPEKEGLKKTYDLVRNWQKASAGRVSCIDTGGATGGSAANRVLEEFKQIAAAGAGEAIPIDVRKGLTKQLAVLVFGSKWQPVVEKAFDDLPPDPAPPQPHPTPPVPRRRTP